MALSVSQKPRELPPVGTHEARCFYVVDLGTQKYVYEGQKRESRKILVGFELFGPKTSEEKNFIVWRRLTLGWGPSAHMRKWAESWLSYNPDVSGEFEPKAFLGKPCYLNVGRRKADDGVVWETIHGVMATPDTVHVPPNEEPLVYLELTADGFDQQVFDGLSDKTKANIKASPEYKEIMDALNGVAVPPPREVQPTEPPEETLKADELLTEDDIPF